MTTPPAATLAILLWLASPPGTATAQEPPPAAEAALEAPVGPPADAPVDPPVDAPADAGPEAPEAPDEADNPDEAAEPTPQQEALDRLRHGAPDVATLAEVLPLLPQPQHRPLIRSKTVEARPPPRAELVALLEHPYLAVRLAALELLEELAGTDHAFNPWQSVTTPDNAAALDRWRAWAGKKEAQAATARVFSDDQRRSYLRDIMAEDADKAARARRMLEADGFAAIGFLETFLADTPTLSPGARTRIREAQYQILLARQIGDGAAELARQLAFGSRDQLLAALGTIAGGGPLALPILRDFITHPEALVRETAIDALLSAGGEEGVKIIAPLMDKEPDANVIHGMLRRIKDIKCAASEELAAKFLLHSDEDLLISAIQTCLSLSGDTDSWSMSGTTRKRPDQDAAIIKCLSDPRWRVRAAALEYVSRRRPAAAKERVLELLDDPDSFVRQGAVAAAVAMKLRDALPKLQAMARADITAAPLVVAAFENMERKLDAETAALLKRAPASVQLEAIQTSQSLDFIGPYAANPDADLACAALRWIAADDDRVKAKGAAGHLLAALRSDDPARVTAVLDRLDMPATRSSRVDPALAQALAGAASRKGEPTALDPLYDAFLLPEPDQPAAAAPSAAPAAPAGGLAELTQELVRFTAPEVSLDWRFPAALSLAVAGHPAGFETLVRDLGELNTARKVDVSQRLYSAADKRAIDLLMVLLRDPVSEVRSAAAESALGGDTSRFTLGLVLNELSRPDSPLQAHEVYGYRIESAARSNAGRITPWIQETLGNDQAPVPHRILALILSRGAQSSRLIPAVRQQTSSPDPNIRRAAWQALLTLRPGEAAANAKLIANDPEARVRLALPDRVASTFNDWRHHFTDTIGATDNLSEYDRRLPRLDAEATAVLERMARRDPSPVVRFECAFALVARATAVDFDEFARLLGKQPDPARARYRITRWLETNASRATPALRPLLALAETSRISPRELAELTRRIAPLKQQGFATFASLAARAEETASGTAEPLLAPEEDTAKPATRTTLPVVYFHKPGCRECARAKEMLDEMKRDFPLLEVTSYNIVDPSGTLLNQTLCDRFQVPVRRHTEAPAVFAQGGFLIKDIAHRELGELLARTMLLPEDDAWRAFDEAARAAADERIERRYRAITLPVVLLGGLIDGLNPCAFATIIFFLSYLQIARRTPREMLLTGVAFIVAVFLAYLAAGLLLHEALDWIYARVGGLRVWLTYGFAALALVAAALSARDALLARRGRLDEMTLQLPGLLKDRIRGVIRTGARARRFIIGAFLAGLAVSLLELACTGQVYAPIIYQIRQGELNAVNWLLLYNLAFIVPLVVVFLLAYGGLRSEALIAFQRRHTFTVKLALAALFLALAAFILLGDRLLSHARSATTAPPPAAESTPVTSDQ